MINRWARAATPIVLALFWAGAAVAQEEGEGLQHAHTDITNIESLQRGSRNFMNYCSGCHSLKYLRYNRLAADLKIPESELGANLMFTSEKSFDGINSAMPADSTDWFGKQPPDLSLMVRARSKDYVYSYLKSFYADPARPWGVNNTVLPGTAMPHVLASLQGLQQPSYKKEKDANGNDAMVLDKLELPTPGQLTPEAYDQFVLDITNFLDYAAEPVKATRQSMGVFVILFLLVFFVFAFLLKKEYWKDVH